MTSPSQHPHQPILQTARLTLIPLADSYLPMQLSLDSNPQVIRYLRSQPRTPEEIRLNLIEQKQLALDNPGLGYWVAHLKNPNSSNQSSELNKATGEAIGWFLLQPPERADQGPIAGQVEIGWRLLPHFWRQGYASEGAREMLWYCFSTLGVGRVFAETMFVNEGSKAVMRKIGMGFVRRFEIEVEEAMLVSGAEEGEVEFAVTKEGWEAR